VNAGDGELSKEGAGGVGWRGRAAKVAVNVERVTYGRDLIHQDRVLKSAERRGVKAPDDGPAGSFPGREPRPQHPPVRSFW